MYIGELAKRCGVSPKAIRHYEALGLLGVVQRAGTYRVYHARDEQMVNLIRQAQALGFRLSELGLLDGANENPDWGQLEELIAIKRQVIAGEIIRLQRLNQMLLEVSVKIRDCPEAQEQGGIGMAACI